MNKRSRFQLVAGGALALFLTAAMDSAKGVTITGTIRDADGNPVAAVTVRVVTSSPASTDSVVTNNDGVYTATVPGSWSGTVTPTDVNFVFDPPSRAYSAVATDQLAQDYTALQGIISIAGYVRTADGVGIPDVVMTGLPANVSTDAQGRYQSFVLRGWTGTVTPTKTNYTFQPPSVPYTSVTANSTADYVGTASQDNTPPTVTPAACGVGACGAGATSWLPLSILGWCGLKLGANYRRRG